MGAIFLCTSGRDALNAQLRGIILERERTTPSVSKSNQGGWQSRPDLFQSDQPAVAALLRLITTAVCARGGRESSSQRS